MLEDGAQFEKLKMRYYSDVYRGAHASRDIKKNECILFVPLKEIITLEMCMESPIGTPMFACGHRKRLISPKHSFFSTFLMEEKRKEVSYWHKYIDILPKDLSAYPIFWNEEEMTWIEGTDMVRMVTDKIRDMRQDYDMICREVPEYTQFPFQEYQCMRLLVASRIFGIEISGLKTDGFVPYADMLNHKRPRETSWTYDNDRQGFTIEALVDLPRGSPVHDSYGRKSNTRFLLNYGFINMDNDADDLPLAFEIRKDDKLFAEKMKMIHTNRYRSYSTMADYEEPVTIKMMSFLRFAEYSDKNESHAGQLIK
jgi:protein-histidine N-methyltransferase